MKKYEVEDCTKYEVQSRKYGILSNFECLKLNVVGRSGGCTKYQIGISVMT